MTTNIIKPKKAIIKNPEKDMDCLMVVLADLIIDSFIDRQQTKGNKTRYIKENELKRAFRDSNSRSSQVRKGLSSTRTAI